MPDPIPCPENTPVDILCDVLLNVSRNIVDTCQMVSKDWHNKISLSSNSCYLPLRLLGEIDMSHISQPRSSLIMTNPKSSLWEIKEEATGKVINFTQVHGDKQIVFKNAIWKKLVFNLKDIFMVGKEIFGLTDGINRAIECEMDAQYVADYRYYDLQQIFTELIYCKILTINHISKSGFDILRFKPEILQLPKTQIFINLWLDDEFNTLDVEQKFIEKFICGQYTFHHGLVIRRYFGDFKQFFAKILEEFKKSGHPKHLFHTIKFEFPPGFNFNIDQNYFGNFFAKHEMKTHYDQENGNLFEMVRPDGLMLKIQIMSKFIVKKFRENDYISFCVMK
uniref:F-box domain-containing protein n=1 Tax=Acrobeloides nanus TaxID=290746 RepID=A0A914E5S3_9BILA